jgi:hypothetical protein
MQDAYKSHASSGTIRLVLSPYKLVIIRRIYVQFVLWWNSKFKITEDE